MNVSAGAVAVAGCGPRLAGAVSLVAAGVSRLAVAGVWALSLVLGDAVAADDGPPTASLAAFCEALPRPAYASLDRIALDSDWFEVYRVAPGVMAIYEPYQWQEVISYLIEGETGALLFDTGNGIADIAAVVAKLTTLPVAVLNSHTHYDHVGGNHAYDEIYGMDTAFTRDRQSGHDNREIAIEVSPAALCRPLPTGVTAATHRGRPFRVSRFIEDGAVIDLGGRRLDVIHIPGHTPDSIALLDAQHGLLWTGDSFYEGPIWLYAPETDLSAYAGSVARLAGMVPGLKAVLPSHNTPWVEPGVLLQLRDGLRAILAGRVEPVEHSDGMIEYRPPGVTRFSFLMAAGRRFGPAPGPARP